MKKKLLFYKFIATLFITSNNIFLCCCDCNSLLYLTCSFDKYKKIISTQWDENEHLEIKINSKKYSVSERKPIKETIVEENILYDFFWNSTTNEEIKEYFFKQIVKNQKNLKNDSNWKKDDISITIENKQDENIIKIEKFCHNLLFYEEIKNIVKEKIKDYYSKVDYFLKIEDIPCVFFREKDSDNIEKNLIIFFHGNGESIFNIYDLYLKINVFSEGYDLLIPELPGYPKNKERDFSIRTREEYIKKILEFCKTYYSNKNIFIIGHSLGCYFATLLASKDENNTIFKKLIIVCPFLTDKTAAMNIVKENIATLCGICCANFLNKNIVNPIYREKLSNEENIKHVKSNIDILYAPNDKVINPKDAESLFNIFKNLKDYNMQKDEDILEKTEFSQMIKLRPIIPKYFLNVEKSNLDEEILKAVKFKKEETEVKTINKLNRLFFREERKVFNKDVGHNDVFLYNQIKYYILN